MREHIRYSVNEIAELPHTTPSGIRHRQCRTPEDLPPSIKIGRTRFWRKTDVTDWLDSLASPANDND